MNSDFGPVLVCNQCQAEYPAATEYRLDCCDGGLLIGRYPRPFEPDLDAPGLWRFTSWLPVSGAGPSPVGSVTFPAPQLGSNLGLDDLWISFNGYWPERGADCPTCSFKDLEVAPTLERLIECGAPGVVVATAGNTGRAFAHLGGLVGFPVVVVVGERHADRIWRPGLPQADSTTVLAIRGGDYGDATDVARKVAPGLRWQLEGGVRNVARRDGIGTLLLDAVLEMGGLPAHYVQAVGGGPGPVGVGEMAERLVADGRYGDELPRFHLVQNVEHQPVNRAWRAGRSRLSPDDFPSGPVEVYADVLVNRAPAYDVRGGLHDLLERTGGRTYAVAADEARRAGGEFEALVGIDVLEPAAVALAGVRQAVAGGDIAAVDRVLVAVTGGGLRRLQRDAEIHPPELLIADPDQAASVLGSVLKRAT